MDYIEPQNQIKAFSVS